MLYLRHRLQTAELEPITSTYTQSDEVDMGMTYVPCDASHRCVMRRREIHVLFLFFLCVNAMRVVVLWCVFVYVCVATMSCRCTESCAS